MKRILIAFIIALCCHTANAEVTCYFNETLKTNICTNNNKNAGKANVKQRRTASANKARTAKRKNVQPRNVSGRLGNSNLRLTVTNR